MDEQHRRANLHRARQMILSAEARLRYYAYVEEAASDDTLTQAKGDWDRAETLLWDTVQEREQVVRSMPAFAEAASALALLMDTLATGGVESPEGPTDDSPAPVP